MLIAARWDGNWFLIAARWYWNCLLVLVLVLVLVLGRSKVRGVALRR